MSPFTSSQSFSAEFGSVIGTNAIPGVFELVVGVLVDLLATLGVSVIEYLFRTSGLHKLEILRRACGDDLIPSPVD